MSAGADGSFTLPRLFPAGTRIRAVVEGGTVLYSDPLPACWTAPTHVARNLGPVKLNGEPPSLARLKAAKRVQVAAYGLTFDAWSHPASGAGVDTPNGTIRWSGMTCTATQESSYLGTSNNIRVNVTLDPDGKRVASATAELTTTISAWVDHETLELTNLPLTVEAGRPMLFSAVGADARNRMIGFGCSRVIFDGRPGFSYTLADVTGVSQIAVEFFDQ